MAIVTRTLNIDLTPIKTAIGGECELIIPGNGAYASQGAFKLTYK